MTRALVYKDPEPDPAYPWYFTVDWPDGCSMDYGSMETWAGAMQAVEDVLAHPDRYEHMDFDSNHADTSEIADTGAFDRQRFLR